MMRNNFTKRFSERRALYIVFIEHMKMWRSNFPIVQLLEEFGKSIGMNGISHFLPIHQGILGLFKFILIKNQRNNLNLTSFLNLKILLEKTPYKINGQSYYKRNYDIWQNLIPYWGAYPCKWTNHYKNYQDEDNTTNNGFDFCWFNVHIPRKPNQQYKSE